MTFVSNHAFPRHSHDHFSVGVMTFGAHRSWSTVGHVEATAGDVIVANPGEIHDGVPLGGRVRGWRIIYIDPQVMSEELRQECIGPIEIVRPVARDPLVSAKLTQLFACLSSTDSDQLAKEESLVRALVCLVRRQGLARPLYNDRSPSVAKAIEQLNEAPNISVSLGELATLSGVSRFQLLRGFSREIGTTPHAYLVQKRVTVARRLLATGETPAAAAAEAGFADQSHMTRAFVRYLGITPARYRAVIV